MLLEIIRVRSVANIDDDLLRKARSGDKDAVLAILSARVGDAEIEAHVAGWHSSRYEFMNRVNAFKHYKRRGWLGVSKPERIKELIEKFGIRPNVAKHLADGRYAPVREEAMRQIKAEAEDDPTT